MLLNLHGGPLDGLQLDLPTDVAKLIVVDDSGRVTRYETSSSWPVDGKPNAEGDATLPRSEVDFDRGLRRAMMGNWDRLI